MRWRGTLPQAVVTRLHPHHETPCPLPAPSPCGASAPFPGPTDLSWRTRAGGGCSWQRGRLLGDVPRGPGHTGVTRDRAVSSARAHSQAWSQRDSRQPLWRKGCGPRSLGLRPEGGGRVWVPSSAQLRCVRSDRDVLEQPGVKSMLCRLTSSKNSSPCQPQTSAL